MTDYTSGRAIVTDDSPLTIKMPGAETANPATLASSVDAVSVGDVVNIEIRTPWAPVITGVEEATA